MRYNIGGYYRYISMGGSLITIVAAMILAILLALPLSATPGESLSTYDDPALLAMIFFTCAFYGVGVLLIILSNKIECKIRAGMLKVSKYTLSKSASKDSISSMLDTIKKIDEIQSYINYDILTEHSVDALAIAYITLKKIRNNILLCI